MRLNKYLAQAGIASRRKCDEIITSGAVSVNNIVVTELGMKVDENKDVVSYNGKVLALPNQFVYYKLYKPKGYICSAKDDRGRKTIFDIVKTPNIRLFSIGRLDYDTQGLLLLTNNGDLAQKLIHPSGEIDKEYYCTINGDIKESELAVLRAGVVENGEKLPKAKVEVMEKVTRTGGVIEKTRLSIVIHEGKNRQIRRMFEGIGREIDMLKRVRIGEIHLGGLARGEYKQLNDKEMFFIQKLLLL